MQRDVTVSLQVFDSEEHAQKNRRRYDPIFDVYRRMNADKRPKKEGIDVITVEDKRGDVTVAGCRCAVN